MSSMLLNKKKHYLPLALALAVSSTLTHGQERRILEEVVVTAQKRQESQQDVPISVSVVSAEDLAAVNIFDFTETAALTPGVDLNAGLQAAAIRLRGVGPAFFAVGSPQSVTVFVDQVAQAQIGAVFATLVDVERVELLRGPQGTLYGQNAPGGAYNISTKAPDFDGFSGYVEGTYSNFDDSDMNNVDVRGAVNLPLFGDALAWRLAGVYADSDGFVSMENPESGDDATGGKDHKAIRSRMLWQISDAMDLGWTVNYQDLTDYPADFNYDGLVPGTGGSNSVAAVYNDFDDRKDFGDFRSQVDADVKDTNIHWRWDAVATDVDLLLNYQEFETESFENRNPYFNAAPSLFNLGIDYELSTVELRFSDSGDVLDYIGGLYYSNRESTGDVSVTISGIDVFGEQEGEDEVMSVFGNTTWHIAETWDLSLGARYDDNETSLRSDMSFLDFQASVDDKLTFDHVSWSVKLRNYINDNTTAYLAIDNGYKQGGFNPLVTGVLPLESVFPDLATVARETVTYDEEISTAFELGIKGTVLSDRLSYSAAIFYQLFDDHQIDQPDDVVALEPLGGLFQGSVTNADEVVTQGVEGELQYLIGDYWDIGVRVAYFDATVEDWDERFCQGGEESSPDQVYCPADSGDALNSLPQWNTNTQLGYSRPLASGREFYSRVNWTWQSEANYTTNTDKFDEDKSRIDLSVGMKDSDLGLDGRLWVKNLTDEDFNLNPGTQDNGDPGQPAAYKGEYYRGIEIGLSLSYAF